MRFFYLDGRQVSGCNDCLTFTTTPRSALGAIDYTTIGTPITVAHLDDIKRRKIDPVTKQVYRDYGRTSFTVGSWKNYK